MARRETPKMYVDSPEIDDPAADSLVEAFEAADGDIELLEPSEL